MAYGLEAHAETAGQQVDVVAQTFGRAQEFSLRYAVVFSMRRGDDTVVVPQQAVELARDYLAPAVDSIGKASERELLVRELRRDMAAAILRRVDAATKSAVKGSG